MWWSDDVCFVQDQYAQNNFYSASSLKQQSVGWHVAPLGHNVILFQSQPVFSLPPSYYLLSRVAANRGYGFLFRSEFFFRTTHELEYLFFLSLKARNIFPEYNIRLYDNNSESDYFIFLHQNQNIFSEKIGNQNIFQKKTVPYGWHLISPFLIFEYNMKTIIPHFNFNLPFRHP